jgi:DME family drug/metabolite transporter
LIRPGRAQWVGYLQALGAACLWGTSGIFAVHLFRMGVPPESVALLRPIVGALGLLACFLLTAPSALRVGPAGVAMLALGGGAAVGVFQIGYQMSIDAVGVPRTVALLYLAPALVVAVSGPLLKEPPTWRRVALAAVAVTGVWTSVAGAEDVESIFASGGTEWGVLAALSYAAYTVFGRWASPRYGAIATVAYSTVGACVVLTALLPWQAGPLVLPASTRAWALLVVFGLATISAAQFLFFAALGRIEADRASTTAAVEPVVAAVLATTLLGQGLRPLGWAGLVLVVAGVAGVGLSARPRGRDARVVDA